MSISIGIHAHQNDEQTFKSVAMPNKSNSNSITLKFCSLPYGERTYATETGISVFSLSDVDATILAGVGLLGDADREQVAALVNKLLSNQGE